MLCIFTARPPLFGALSSAPVPPSFSPSSFSGKMRNRETNWECYFTAVKPFKACSSHTERSQSFVLDSILTLSSVPHWVQLPVQGFLPCCFQFASVFDALAAFLQVSSAELKDSHLDSASVETPA